VRSLEVVRSPVVDGRSNEGHREKSRSRVTAVGTVEGPGPFDHQRDRHPGLCDLGPGSGSL